MKELIQSSKIIVCVGSGGVGKTTFSASLGYLAAREGKRVLVLTIDPARRLIQALGLEGLKGGDKEVKNLNLEGRLFAGIVDAEKTFAEFIDDSSEEKSSADKLKDNFLYQQLATNLNGSQEFTSLYRLLRYSQDERFDLIILDTPPAQNAMDFFAAPEKLYAMFQHSITKWFAAAEDERNFFVKVVNKGTTSVLAALEKVTGSDFIRQLSDFFQNVRGIQDSVSERSIDVHKLLLQESSRFILVTGFDQVKMEEGQRIYSDLRKRGFNIKAIVVNRCFPLWFKDGENNVDPSLEGIFKDLNSFFERKERHLNEFSANLDAGLPLVKVPEIDDDKDGIDQLKWIADHVSSQ